MTPGATQDSPGAALKLIFLGTRGNTDISTRRHRRHSAALVIHRGRTVMIDCGEDWLGRVSDIAPSAIVLTHAHPDHAGGLGTGIPCPVLATRETWARLDDHVSERRVLERRTPTRVAGMSFEAFPVEHSVLAPAVGYRVHADAWTFFYVPDLVSIPQRREALRGVQLYVGDGARVTRPLVRRHAGRLIGHAPIRTQLAWCEAERVPRAIFTHCGTEILRADQRRLGARLRALGRECGVAVQMAYDGLQVSLGGGG